MNKTVNIDGREYIIESCECCPFYDWGDEGYHDHCQYPVNPSTLKEHTAWGMDCIAEDCPLRDAKEEKE